MRADFDSGTGVTHVGPRAFVVGFAIVCGVFVASVYAADRIGRAIETPLPAKTAAGPRLAPSTPGGQALLVIAPSP